MNQAETQMIADYINTALAYEPSLDLDATVTRILENNLTHLESLRSGIERAGFKDIPDVRDYGDTFAASLLHGFEHRVSYQDLIQIIEVFKNGIAGRRVL